MFSAGRWIWVLPFLLLPGCSRPTNCCGVILSSQDAKKPGQTTEAKPTPMSSGPAACCCEALAAEDNKAAAKIDVQPVGPNSVPMMGGTIHRNLANTVEKNIPDTWSIAKDKQVNIKWSAKLGTNAFGGPVIAGGRVLVGTNNESPRDKADTAGGQPIDKGVLMCFRESDGKFLWQITHDKNPPGIDFEHMGVISTPAVERDRLYYVSNRCELICADVAGDTATGKGKIVWKLDMIKDLNVYPGGLDGSVPNSSPLIIGDLVCVLTSNGTDNGKTKEPKAPSLVAVNKTTGKVVWSDNSPGDKIMDGQWSSPVAAEANGEMLVIYGAGDGWLYALAAKTGELRWKFDCNPKAAVFKAGGTGSRGFVVATPIVWENKLYVGVGAQPDHCNGGVGRLWCLDITKKPANKDKDVSAYCDPKDPNPQFNPKDPRNKDSALVWHYGGSVVPKPVKERSIVFGRTISTCAIHDGLLYAAETTGYFHCLDAKTGQHYYEYDLKDSTWNSPYYVDGKVYLGVDSGNMFVFKAGKELKELAKIDMSEQLKVPPAAANGVLFLTNGTTLFAIANKK